MAQTFRRLARTTAWLVGSAGSFVACVLGSLLWLAGGFVWGFGPAYQLYYNTTVSALTLILVVLLQNSQNTDLEALHLKLDELLRALSEARSGLIDLESLPEDELERLHAEFSRLREQHSDQP